MKIAIDATPVAHGSRAVRRHTRNLIESLLDIDSVNNYKFLYVDWQRQRSRYVSLPTSSRLEEHIVAIPGRLLVPSWRYLALPKSEWLVGPFDIFYATDLYFPPANRGSVLGSVRGIAYHVIEDKLVPNEVESLKKGLAYTLRNSDYLLAVSYKTKEELMERLNIPHERIYVVRHGIDHRFRRVKNRDALFERLERKLGFTSQYILFVGVIGYHKNVMNILKAYEIVWNEGVKAPLVLAGPPGMAWREVQEWIIRKGFRKDIHLLGLVDQDSDELTDLYNGASLFVFPSFYEGWAAPPLEAMACGTPVITSNWSSLPETVNDAAIQIDPNDPEELAYQMGRVLSEQSLREDLINRGIKHVTIHTWENAATKLLQTFSDIQSRGPWRGQK